jgi:hypothetical protein
MKPVVAEVGRAGQAQDSEHRGEQNQGCHRTTCSHRREGALALSDYLVALNYGAHQLQGCLIGPPLSKTVSIWATQGPENWAASLDKRDHFLRAESAKKLEPLAAGATLFTDPLLGSRL